jgi:hypothetical protein
MVHVTKTGTRILGALAHARGVWFTVINVMFWCHPWKVLTDGK